MSPHVEVSRLDDEQ